MRIVYLISLKIISIFPYLYSVGPSQILSRIAKTKFKRHLQYLLFSRCLFKEYHDFFKFISRNPDFNGQMLQDGVAAFFCKLFNTKDSDNKLVIEIGAADVKKYSNSHTLIESFGWYALLFEPIKDLYLPLANFYSNNSKVQVINRAVVKPGTPYQVEMQELSYLSTLSSIESDLPYKKLLRQSHKIMVNTIETHKIPQLIINQNYGFIYLSIDVEGYEYQIIKNWNFSALRPHLISVEYNFNPTMDQKITSHLVNLGYKKVFKRISSIDRFFVLSD